MPKLVCKGVTFYSQNDEIVFFDWISRIEGIKSWEGIVDEVHLHIPKKTVSDLCLRDLTALFYRYKIDMTQLQQFITEKNRDWYTSPKMYWHNKLFKGKLQGSDLNS